MVSQIGLIDDDLLTTFDAQPSSPRTESGYPRTIDSLGLEPQNADVNRITKEYEYEPIKQD
jgi:hypothetical protein